MSKEYEDQPVLDNIYPPTKKVGPVECLGMEFENDEARKEYFLNILREKLKDPEFRKIEGFPIGENEDILALSDPPYYTACPNPFIEDFINQYGKPYDPNEKYSREPFAADVSEGKNDPIYNAHSYHTKVPHKAIMRYILHYTEPGDVVFDGFCGTGMTGVAAQLCGDKKTVESLGYRVLPDGTILDNEGKPFSKLGARYAILNDLSPAATFIAYNYNTPVDVHAFEQEARRILKEVEDECGWMYNTIHVEPASSRLKEITGFKPAENSKFEPAESVNNKPAGSRHHISSFTQRRDNLPHWQLPGAFYFLTFNTHNRRILSEKSRDIVLQSLLYWSVEPASSRRVRFIAAVVMPDHVHAVIQPLEKSPGVYWDLSDIMHSIKSYSANEINKVEGTIGQTVWQTETYDHIIRNDREYGFVLQYIANNPVVESLAEKPEDYIWFKVSERVEEAGWKPTLLGKINYTVWSDVFVCPECTKELVFWECAVDKEAGKVRDEFPCPNCGVKLTKRNMERAWVTKFDKAINQTIRQAKQVPVLINYTANGKRHEKAPDDFDSELMDKIEKSNIPYWFPTDRMPEGYNTKQPKISHGLTHVHHFYTKRNLWVLSATLGKFKEASSILFGRDYCVVVRHTPLVL